MCFPNFACSLGSNSTFGSRLIGIKSLLRFSHCSNPDVITKQVHHLFSDLKSVYPARGEGSAIFLLRLIHIWANYYSSLTVITLSFILNNVDGSTFLTELGVGFALYEDLPD